MLHLDPKTCSFLGEKVGEPLKNTGLQKVPLTRVLSPDVDREHCARARACVCLLTACVFESTSLRTVCLNHDVTRLMSSDHMKRSRL